MATATERAAENLDGCRKAIGRLMITKAGTSRINTADLAARIGAYAEPLAARFSCAIVEEACAELALSHKGMPDLSDVHERCVGNRAAEERREAMLGDEVGTDQARALAAIGWPATRYAGLGPDAARWLIDSAKARRPAGEVARGLERLQAGKPPIPPRAGRVRSYADDRASFNRAADLAANPRRSSIMPAANLVRWYLHIVERDQGRTLAAEYASELSRIAHESVQPVLAEYL